MKWLEVSRWMLVIGELIILGLYLRRMRKIKKYSQYDAIEAHLIAIRFWIVTIFFILTVDKMGGIVLAILK